MEEQHNQAKLLRLALLCLVLFCSSCMRSCRLLDAIFCFCMLEWLPVVFFSGLSVHVINSEPLKQRIPERAKTEKLNLSDKTTPYLFAVKHLKVSISHHHPSLLFGSHSRRFCHRVYHHVWDHGGTAALTPMRQETRAKQILNKLEVSPH